MHHDLVAYAEALARETGAGPIEPTKLIAPMFARIMASDRAFTKLQREVVGSKKD